MTHPLSRRPPGPLAALGLVVGIAACARAQAPAQATLDARLLLPTHDTVRIRAPATAHRCDSGAGVLLIGIDGGAGVLVRTQATHTLASGDYPLLARGDTTTEGAKASVRFMSGEAGRGVELDSGTVTLTLDQDRVSARIRGSGLEPAGGVRARLEADFRPLPLAPGTASCR